MRPEDGMAECEEPLSGAELLYRQITRLGIDPETGNVSPKAFGSTKGVDRTPSMSRSSMTTPQASREWHNANARSSSLGVWAVTPDECDSAGVGAVDDSACPLEEDEVRAPAHAYLNYKPLGKSEIRLVRRLVWQAARTRGKVI